MSEAKELCLTGLEIAAGLRCCTKDPNDAGGCKVCPLNEFWTDESDLKCYDRLNLMAADRLEELTEENRKLRGATEEICQRELKEMIRLAGEANMALDRGLAGVSEAHFAKMQEHQAQLAELGRESIIQAEPMKEHGWRIDRVTVGGLEVYRRKGRSDA